MRKIRKTILCQRSCGFPNKPITAFLGDLGWFVDFLQRDIFFRHLKLYLPRNHTENSTFFLLPKMFQDNESQHCTSHQSCQYAKHNANHIVITDQNHSANIVGVSINCHLPERHFYKSTASQIEINFTNFFTFPLSKASPSLVNPHWGWWGY